MSGANVTIAGNLTVTGNATASGSTITLGDAATDTIAFGGTITGNLVFEGSSDDAHELTLSPGNPTSDVTVTLPIATDTLVGKATTDTLTNKTLTTPVIAEIDSSADITLDAAADIVLDAAGGNVEFKDAGTLQLTIDMDTTSGVQIVKLGVDSDDLVFQQYDGNEVVRMADDRRLYFYDKGGEYIYGDGTDLHIVSGNDINIPANIGMTFGDDGEKIEGDGTDLTIASSAKINLTATSDVHIPDDIGIVFGGDSEKIEGDGTDLTISANNLTVDAVADITLDAGGADIVLKDDGTEFGRFTNSSGELVIKSSSSSTTALTFSGSSATLAGNLTVTGTTTFNGGTITLGDAATDTVAFGGTITGNLIFEGSTADNYETTLTPANPSADITVTMPSSTGTLARTADVQFPNSTRVTHPAASGNVDLADGETPFESILDAFSIVTGDLFDNQDPKGSTATVDLGALS
jgi:hypothetical protein